MPDSLSNWFAGIGGKAGVSLEYRFGGKCIGFCIFLHTIFHVNYPPVKTPAVQNEEYYRFAE